MNMSRTKGILAGPYAFINCFIISSHGNIKFDFAKQAGHDAVNGQREPSLSFPEATSSLAMCVCVRDCLIKFRSIESLEICFYEHCSVLHMIDRVHQEDNASQHLKLPRQPSQYEQVPLL
jgi:hypothetical protein